MTYEVYILPKANKKLEKFPDAERIKEKLKALENFPNVRNVIKIGENLYRMRIGDYRALFKVYEKEKVIVVINVDVRGRIYKHI